MYKNNEINDCLLNIYDNEFISFDITNNIVNCNSNHYKHLSFIAYICENNHENNFHTSITDIGIEKNQIYSSCIYNNIDDKRHNLIL